MVGRGGVLSVGARTAGSIPWVCHPKSLGDLEFFFFRLQFPPQQNDGLDLMISKPPFSLNFAGCVFSLTWSSQSAKFKVRVPKTVLTPDVSDQLGGGGRGGGFQNYPQFP